eukprot:TRINITY_DN9252_c0_g1_i1.p1 TRINITY_DN9252_c0_g1~~TRINITY_DN9252_c0_g1_i1.p1  ORF type:complete len:401 (+),score=94.70 TRINITY_DN9252_c0_g1_i1:56-1258(+)
MADLQDKKATVLFPTGFALKLWDIVEEEETNNVIGWEHHGQSFTIREPHVFIQKVLPKYFQHCNMCSFIRQLNLYGFSKTTEPHMLEFRHPNFIQGRKDSLKLIQRRKTDKRGSNREAVDGIDARALEQEFLARGIQQQSQDLYHATQSPDSSEQMPQSKRLVGDFFPPSEQSTLEYDSTQDPDFDPLYSTCDILIQSPTIESQTLLGEQATLSTSTSPGLDVAETKTTHTNNSTAVDVTTKVDRQQPVIQELEVIKELTHEIQSAKLLLQTVQFEVGKCKGSHSETRQVLQFIYKEIKALKNKAPPQQNALSYPHHENDKKTPGEWPELQDPCPTNSEESNSTNKVAVQESSGDAIQLGVGDSLSKINLEGTVESQFDFFDRPPEDIFLDQQAHLDFFQ